MRKAIPLHQALDDPPILFAILLFVCYTAVLRFEKVSFPLNVILSRRFVRNNDNVPLAKARAALLERVYVIRSQRTFSSVIFIWF